MNREEGVLLQAHGDTMETRGHWYMDAGGGEWLKLVLWHNWKGEWSPRDCDDLSGIALEALRVLLNERASSPPGSTPGTGETCKANGCGRKRNDGGPTCGTTCWQLRGEPEPSTPGSGGVCGSNYSVPYPPPTRGMKVHRCERTAGHPGDCGPSATPGRRP